MSRRTVLIFNRFPFHNNVCVFLARSCLKSGDKKIGQNNTVPRASQSSACQLVGVVDARLQGDYTIKASSKGLAKIHACFWIVYIDQLL